MVMLFFSRANRLFLPLTIPAANIVVHTREGLRLLQVAA
jgi:hypothetical protein